MTFLVGCSAVPGWMQRHTRLDAWPCRIDEAPCPDWCGAARGRA